jgi:hypothetical protein
MHVSGGAVRDLIEFQSEKLAPRVFQVTLQSPMGKGEFGFAAAGSLWQLKYGQQRKDLLRERPRIDAVLPARHWARGARC